MKLDILPAAAYFQRQAQHNHHHHLDLNHLNRHDFDRHQQNSLNQQQQQHYLSIEDIKSTRNSCRLCGCNWLENHVSLDCSECGGYALKRPCVNCDGKCGETWERDIGGSHDSHRARFSGRCRLHHGRPSS